MIDGKSRTGSPRFDLLKQYLITAATIAGLAAVGWGGHSTHWTFQWHADTTHAASNVGLPHHPDGRATSESELFLPPKSSFSDDGQFQIQFASEAAVTRAGIQTATVTERALVQEITATGVISYDDRRVAQLAPRVAGSVWRVDKHLGDTVRKGEILAVIEADAVGKMKAEFLNSLVALDSHQEVYRNLEAVKDSIPGRQLRQAMSELRETRIRLLNAEQSLLNLGLAVEQADYALLSDEERSLRVRVLGLPESLTSSVNSSKLSSNLLPLLAPFDGVVISRDAVVGEVVDPGRPAFEIADTSRMWITLDITKENVSAIIPGQTLHFRPDGMKTDLTGQVDWMSTELDEQTRTLKVRAQVDNPILAGNNRVLRSHTYGTGRIVVGQNPIARVVPRDSVQWDGQSYVVFVKESPTLFSGRAVALGLQDRDYVEIVDPPVAGTVVAVAGSHMLKSQWQFSRMETASR